MAKEELLEFDGTVTEVLPDGNFRVKLDNEHEVLAYTAGKMRKFRIRTGVGDRVIVEMSPYDLQRGRISFRHKGDAPIAWPAATPAELPPPLETYYRGWAHVSIAGVRRAMTVCFDLASRAGDHRSPALSAPLPRKTSRRTSRKNKPRPRRAARSRQRRACGCCRPIPSPSMRSTPPRGKLAYTATAGTLAFYDQSGDQSAAVFYTAYVAKDAGANRPLTFVFNGGPGAASAFLHLGLVGPRILDLGPDGRDAATRDVARQSRHLARALPIWC